MYHLASNHYTDITHVNLHPLSLNQDTITHFVARMAQSGVAYQSIRSDLSGIRFLQIVNGLPDPHIETFHMLGYVLWGVQWAPYHQPLTVLMSHH